MLYALLICPVSLPGKGSAAATARHSRASPAELRCRPHDTAVRLDTLANNIFYGSITAQPIPSGSIVQVPMVGVAAPVSVLKRSGPVKISSLLGARPLSLPIDH